MQKYALQSYITIRKEWFGVLICNPRTGEFYQFNEDMLIFLKFLETPKTLEELNKSLTENNFEIEENKIIDIITEFLLNDIISKDSYGNKILNFDSKTPNGYLSSPSSVTIYITQYCGKTCRHCVTESHPKIIQSSELKTKDWKKILLKLKKTGVMGLVFTGGEPLSKDGIMEILQFADKLNFRISLLTDYDDISESLVKDLQKLKNLADLQTSLDGASKETHDFIRGKGSFEKTLNRLQILKDSKITYTISCSVNSKNFHEIDAIAEISNKYNASFLYLNPVAPYGRAKKAMKKYILNPEQLYQLGQKYLQLTNDNIIDPGNSFWKQNLHNIGNKDFNPFGNALNAFSLGIYNFSIAQKGECYLDSKMKAENILYLGNALSENIDEMWNSSKLSYLREYSKKGNIFIDITEI